MKKRFQKIISSLVASSLMVTPVFSSNTNFTFESKDNDGKFSYINNQEDSVIIDCNIWVNEGQVEYKSEIYTLWTWTGTDVNSGKKLKLLVTDSGGLKIPFSTFAEPDAEYECNNILREASKENNDNSLYRIDITQLNHLVSLNNECFSRCISISEVIIPETITSIGNQCFWQCSKLKNIILPEGLSSLGESAFSDCSSLTTINFPKSLTSISDRCFSGCFGFENIIVPDTIIEINKFAFFNCINLENIVLPNTINKLPESCFQYSYKLENVVIPESVNTIGNSCFAGCKSLKIINIPTHVNFIDKYCFQECESLQRINIFSTQDKVKVSYRTFDTFTKTEIYFQDKNLYDKYHSNTVDGWNEYNWISEKTTINFSKYWFFITQYEIEKSIVAGTIEDGLVIGSFQTFDGDGIDSSTLKPKIEDWRASKGTSNKIELSIVENEKNELGTIYDIVASWSESTIFFQKDWIRFNIYLYNSDDDLLSSTKEAEIYFWTIYEAPKYSRVYPIESNRQVNTGEVADKVNIGTFYISNYSEIDDASLNLSAKFDNWTSTNGTTENNITLEVEQSKRDTSFFLVKASWNANTFIKPDSIDFDIVALNNNVEATRTQFKECNWKVVYSELTSIQIEAVDNINHDSITINDWDQDTVLLFNAIPDTFSDPNALKKANWSITGKTTDSENHIKIKWEGDQAWLEVPKNLRVGTYDITIVCKAQNVDGTLDYQINKVYRAWDMNDYEITGETSLSSPGRKQGESSEALNISSKPNLNGVNPDFGAINFSIRNVVCLEDSSYDNHNIYINDDNKICWDAVDSSSNYLTFNFDIVATFADHGNAEAIHRGSLFVSNVYAQDIRIEANNATSTTIQVTAGQGGLLDGILRIADVRDDSGATNWLCNYHGKYTMEWSNGYDNGTPVTDLFQLEENSNFGQKKIYDLKYSQDLKPGTSYSIDVKYVYNNSESDNNFSGTSNVVTIVIECEYAIPESEDIIIDGATRLEGVQAVSGKSNLFSAKINDDNMNNPDAKISFELLDKNDNIIDNRIIWLENNDEGNGVTIRWSDSINADTYELKLYAVYTIGGEEIKSIPHSIELVIKYADPSSVRIVGDSELDAKSRIKSSTFSIQALSSNGHIESIDQKIFDSKNYKWLLWSDDVKTMNAITSNWISIVDGVLSWTDNLQHGYSYKVSIIAIYDYDDYELTYDAVISSPEILTTPEIIGVTFGIIFASLIIFWIYRRFRKKINDSSKHGEFLTTFKRKRQ